MKSKIYLIQIDLYKYIVIPIYMYFVIYLPNELQYHIMKYLSYSPTSILIKTNEKFILKKQIYYLFINNRFDIFHTNDTIKIVTSTNTYNLNVEIAKTKGVRRAILLPVSAPFHCSLMKPAAEKMLESLSSIKINNPKVAIVTNISAHKIQGEPDEIRRSLVLQVTSMVRWQESIKWMANNGIKSMVEIGAGQVLSGLNKRIDKDLKSTSIEDPDTIDEFLKNLR